MTEHSPTAQQLFDELAAEHLRHPEVSRRLMFGREGLNFNGKFFAFLSHDQLVLKLPAATAAALLTAGEALAADTVSPTMRLWVSVPMPATIAGHNRWRQLMADAYANVGGTSNTTLHGLR
jgi:TfoX/Sxy family transcriptional regulator of competence genes